jgi:hypothetical protein
LIVTGEAAAVIIAAAFFLSQPPVAGLERAGSMLPKPTIIGLILDASTNGKLLVATTTIDVTTANVFKLVNGANRQSIELMSTQTSASALEGLRIKTVSGANYEIGAFEGSASGSVRGLSFGVYNRATPTALTRWMELSTIGQLTLHSGIFDHRRYGDNATASQLQLKKYRGTELTPTGMFALDFIGQVLFQGHNGSTIATSASIQAQATQDFTASSAPTRVTVSTTPVGSLTPAIRAVFTENGLVAVGPWAVAVPLAAEFTILGNNSGGAESNSLRFHDVSSISGIGQVLGKIEFYSADATSSLQGVRAFISCISEASNVANSAIVFATDTTAGTPVERMRIKATGVITFEKLHGQTTEVTYTPPAGTPSLQTITLDSGTMQTLALTSTTSTPTAVTLTVPTIGSARGSIIVKQHGTTARDITWAVSAGTIKWLGTQPTWSSDAINAVRDVRWRWDGSVMYLEASAAG